MTKFTPPVVVRGFTNSRDGRCELFAFLRVQNIKLEVRMGGRSKSKDSSLRRIHAGDYSDSMAAPWLRSTAVRPRLIASNAL